MTKKYPDGYPIRAKYKIIYFLIWNTLINQFLNNIRGKAE